VQARIRPVARYAGRMVFLTAALWAGCQGSEEAKGPPISPAAQAEATQIFSTRCMACHGPDGRGDGPASASLSPKPANFRDVVWQGRVDDGHIEKIIQYGGAAVGKSPTMPSNPDLTSKPEVVAALRAHVRGLSD
jgi:mono/diheme cytochrome c family protein